MGEEPTIGEFVLGITTMGATILAAGWIGYCSANKIPICYDTEVQEGYVLPNKLEMELDDMDRNDKKEVVVKYDGTPYMFVLDKQGKPVVVPYKIQPSEDCLKFEVKPLEEK